MLFCTAVILFLLDASGSIEDNHWRDMIQGHSEAISSENVQRVIQNDGPIAISVYAFSDTTTPLMTFRVLRTPQDAIQAARDLQSVVRPFAAGTRIGDALKVSVDVLENESPCETDNKIIDLVSDGESPDHRIAEESRDRAQDLGIRINVLGVGRVAEDWLNRYARTAGGFYIGINSMSDIIPSLRRKIISELASTR